MRQIHKEISIQKAQAIRKNLGNLITVKIQNIRKNTAGKASKISTIHPTLCTPKVTLSGRSTRTMTARQRNSPIVWIGRLKLTTAYSQQQ